MSVNSQIDAKNETSRDPAAGAASGAWKESEGESPLAGVGSTSGK